MKNETSIIETLDKLRLSDSTLKLTDLRKAILKIIIQANKPISAYDILEKLKKKRESAEPPTVYRVIEYFLKRDIIHKIAAENKYVVCTQIDGKKSGSHGFIFVCKQCSSVHEIMDENFGIFINALAKKNQFSMDGSLVELQGMCRDCKMS